METGVQLFNYARKITACALGEPSLTLVQNDAAFGLLLADGAHEDSYASRLYLDSVTYLHVYGTQWSYTDFPCVAIYREHDIWLAEEMATGRFFPQPSKLPYHIIFISHAEFRSLQTFRNKALAFPVFECAQKHFGRLPGFSFHRKSLETPDDYATAPEAVPIEQYVTAG